MSEFDPSYAQYMDHTVLKAEAGHALLTKFCDEAKEWGFASVCVNPVNVAFVAEQLHDSGVKTCSVVGFPLGAALSEVKAFEASRAVADGAEEIDMVINVGALKDERFDDVESDIRAVVDASHPDAAVKVIIETSLLNDDEIVKACELAVAAGADWVKTSTGFGSSGATVPDVTLMKATVGDRALVKASTGINNREICDAMLAAGARRFGTSKGILIVKGEEAPTTAAY